jgi:hypothetical protein
VRLPLRTCYRTLNFRLDKHSPSTSAHGLNDHQSYSLVGPCGSPARTAVRIFISFYPVIIKYLFFIKGGLLQQQRYGVVYPISSPTMRFVSYRTLATRRSHPLEDMELWITVNYNTVNDWNMITIYNTRWMLAR